MQMTVNDRRCPARPCSNKLFPGQPAAGLLICWKSAKKLMAHTSSRFCSFEERCKKTLLRPQAPRRSSCSIDSDLRDAAQKEVHMLSQSFRASAIFAAWLAISLLARASLAQTPPFLGPPAPPEIARPFPPLPPTVAFRLDMPSATAVRRVIPKLEIRHATSVLPQKPKRHVQRNTCAAQAYIAGNDPVAVRLRFDSSAHGKTVVLSAGRGVTFQPALSVLQVGANGECGVSLVLDPAVSHSVVTFSCEGITTALTVKRATAGYVATQELLAAP